MSKYGTWILYFVTSREGVEHVNVWKGVGAGVILNFEIRDRQMSVDSKSQFVDNHFALTVVTIEKTPPIFGMMTDIPLAESRAFVTKCWQVLI